MHVFLSKLLYLSLIHGIYHFKFKIGLIFCNNITVVGALVGEQPPRGSTSNKIVIIIISSSSSSSSGSGLVVVVVLVVVVEVYTTTFNY